MAEYILETFTKIEQIILGHKTEDNMNFKRFEYNGTEV